MTYTTHGHHIPGTTKHGEKPDQVARCGGVVLCTRCRAEAQAVDIKDLYKPRHMKD